MSVMTDNEWGERKERGQVQERVEPGFILIPLVSAATGDPSPQYRRIYLILAIPVARVARGWHALRP